MASFERFTHSNLIIVLLLPFCPNSDGALPCEPCQRAHAYEVKTRPATAPDEPACEYDHPDMVAEGPKGRIARLESQIGV